MNEWDCRFLELANLVGSWSKDSTKVGAVIVDGKRIVSVGYNGFPEGCQDDPATLEDREKKLLRTVHAETNAILYAKRDLTGCVLYVTHPPCSACAGVIIQSGIKEVITRLAPPGFHYRWKDMVEMTETMFDEARVVLRSI